MPPGNGFISFSTILDSGPVVRKEGWEGPPRKPSQRKRHVYQHPARGHLSPAGWSSLRPWEYDLERTDEIPYCRETASALPSAFAAGVLRPHHPISDRHDLRSRANVLTESMQLANVLTESMQHNQISVKTDEAHYLSGNCCPSLIVIS